MRRHEFDPISFVFGMIFAVLGLAFLSGRVDLGDLHLRWLWPVPLIAVGLALLATTRRRDPDRAVPGPATAPQPDAPPQGPEAGRESGFDLHDSDEPRDVSADATSGED
ncbi:MAG: hypothetical protein M3Q23_06445 [Actinomycetota bacterium]|nr:hypothetical protein [Actinomycetota bacterium]